MDVTFFPGISTVGFQSWPPNFRGNFFPHNPRQQHCIVPWCRVTFSTHPEIIPVGQFFRWIQSINQSSVDFHCKPFGWLVDWLIDEKLTLTWLVYWIRTAWSVFTGARLKWPSTAGQCSMFVCVKISRANFGDYTFFAGISTVGFQSWPQNFTYTIFFHTIHGTVCWYTSLVQL